MNSITTVLAGLRGVSFLGLTIETVVPLKGGKANHMKDRVTKRVAGTVLVAQNKNTNTYQNMVRNKIVGELLNELTEKMEKATEAQSLLQGVLAPDEFDMLSQKIEAALSQTDEDRREAAEERFEVSARKWGERIPNTPIIQHVRKGETLPNYYLDTIWLRAGTPEFFLDGQPIAEDQIIGYEKPQAKEGPNVQGGLKAENQVIVRSIGLDSIRAIRTGGKEITGQFVL